MRIILPTLLSLFLFATSTDALQLCAKADLKGPDPTKPRNNSPIKLRETCKPIKEVSIGTTDKLLAADTQPLLKDANGQTVGTMVYFGEGGDLRDGTAMIRRTNVGTCFSQIAGSDWGFDGWEVYFTTADCSGVGYQEVGRQPGDMATRCEATWPIGSVQQDLGGDRYGPSQQEVWAPLPTSEFEELEVRSYQTSEEVGEVYMGVCKTSATTLPSARAMMRIGTFTLPYHVE